MTKVPWRMTVVAVMTSTVMGLLVTDAPAAVGVPAMSCFDKVAYVKELEATNIAYQGEWARIQPAYLETRKLVKSKVVKMALRKVAQAAQSGGIDSETYKAIYKLFGSGKC